MIFLWRESNEDLCSKENSYEEEYWMADKEFEEKYGQWGEKLQTKEELEEIRKRGGGRILHTMEEVPEYKEIYDKYFDEEQKIEEYRRRCKDEAIDLLKEHFYALWD